MCPYDTSWGGPDLGSRAACPHTPPTIALGSRFPRLLAQLGQRKRTPASQQGPAIKDAKARTLSSNHCFSLCIPRVLLHPRLLSRAPTPHKAPPYLAILLTPRLSFHPSPSSPWAFPQRASSCGCPARGRGGAVPGGKGERKRGKRDIIRKRRRDQHQGHDPQLPLPRPGGDTRLGTPAFTGGRRILHQLLPPAAGMDAHQDLFFLDVLQSTKHRPLALLIVNLQERDRG